VSHCDPETLALRALGEVVGTPEEDAHLASCEQCQREVSSLRQGVLVASAAGPELMTLEAPPAQVWDRITAELAADEADIRSLEPAPEPEATVADVVPLRRRSRPATWLLAAAGIGGIVVGGVATAVLLDGSSAPQSTVAASVDLDPLPAWEASGSAQLTIAEDGSRVLQVTVDAAAAAGADGFQEVWLIDQDVAGMVSLGNLEGTSGEFVIPDGVEVSDFPIVDVSLEPLDGDPTHSGDSIVRGTFDV
jgi:hypothetical protein